MIMSVSLDKYLTYFDLGIYDKLFDNELRLCNLNQNVSNIIHKASCMARLLNLRRWLNSSTWSGDSETIDMNARKKITTNNC